MVRSNLAGSRRPSAWPGPRLLLASLLGALIVGYWPAIGGAFLWDDAAHVTAPPLQGLPGLYRIWFELGATQQYYPLLHSFFWAQHRLWGEWVSGYHLVGILLHALNGLLLYTVLRRLTISAGAAGLAALVWALHPVMVESVAWITEQKNTLSGAFYLGALLKWFQFDESRRPRHYFLALALFVMALLCKTVTATLPAAILLLFWWKRGTLSLRHDVMPLLPLFVLGVGAGLFTAWVESHLIGAQGSTYDLNLLQRGLLAGRVVWFYLGKLVWPADLLFVYPRWTIDPGLWWQWLFPAGALALAAVLWSYRATFRGALAGYLFFVGTLVPVLGFLNVYPFQFSYVADHFQYLASMGILVPLSVAVAWRVERLSGLQLRLGRFACVAVVLTLGALTCHQSRNYQDNGTLFRAVAARNPDSWLAHEHLGIISHSGGRKDEALAHFRTVIALNPEHSGANLNMGSILMEQGRIQDAVEAYNRAVRLDPKNALAHYSLGVALAQVERWQEAIDHYRQSLQLGLEATLEPEARLGLGEALLRTLPSGPATTGLEGTPAPGPSDPAADCSLAIQLLAEGQSARAVTYLERALQARPDFPEALNCLAWIRATDAIPANRNAVEAVRLARRAVELTDRRNPHYLDTLAAALAESGSFEEAVTTAREAITLARAAGNMELAQEIETRLGGYQADRSARVPPSAP